MSVLMGEAARAVDDARTVGAAARSVLQSIRSGADDLDVAVDWLEASARRTAGDQVSRFDAHAAEPTDEELLAVAAAQLGIGTTLLSAEAAVESPSRVGRLEAAVRDLDVTADSIELEDGGTAARHRFDAGPTGTSPSVREAAHATLDEMADAAADVATAVLDRTLKPLVACVPESLRNLVADLRLDVGARLTRWGLRAVRRGLDLLQHLVDIDAVERIRARIDGVLARLGQDEDAAVLAGWAIGADAVREELGSRDPHDERSQLVAELDELTNRFAKLCRMLRRVAVALTGAAAALALLQITVPHAASITAVGLVLVLGATIVMGRDYTGASDIPGRVRGVRLVLGVAP
ncbi:hypothetical protein FHX44_11337 [Pseudonocardia hierapolitana]|uniref:Uncharacterized protein n=2 Tax=Pseudonocardia hierapolitana TaxID=1128676 RepID=A0A561SHX1_9PSEU|nr:hypothetical protein FHX44_11337 [Pseudonocardia hierapolitana]